MKTDYENLTNELRQTKQMKDDLQSLLDEQNPKESILTTSEESQTDSIEFENTSLSSDDTHLQLCKDHEQTIATLKEQLENLRLSLNDRSMQYENELKEKSSRITQLEQTESELRDELVQQRLDIEKHLQTNAELHQSLATSQENHQQQLLAEKSLLDNLHLQIKETESISKDQLQVYCE